MDEGVRLKRTIAILTFVVFFWRITVLAVNEPANQRCLELIGTQGIEKIGGAHVRIALVDSGIHVDNSYMDRSRIARGKNYVFEGNDTNDLIGHGTTIAGIILGITSEKQRIAPIVENVSLIPLVCFSRYPSGVPANSGVEGVCQAIYDAIDEYNCQIINISSGIDWEDGKLLDAVLYAEEKGVVIISAVGNSYQYAPERVFYPAAYETVVGVGSVDMEGKVSEFSQRNTSVMVVAPGENVHVFSPVSGNVYKQARGTSYAAAYATAFAARLLSTHPEMTPGEFRQVLRSSSKDMGESGYDTDYGWGLIDVGTALVESKTKYVHAILGPAEKLQKH